MAVEECFPGMVEDAVQESGVVVSQRQLAVGTYAIRLRAPMLSSRIKPGQFFMIRPSSGSDPLLGRPFALYDTVVNGDSDADEFEFAYHVIGKMTGLMSEWSSGESVELWGPLGNGFPVFEGKHLMCVGGGIGYTPFLAVAQEVTGQRDYGRSANAVPSKKESRCVTLCYGARDSNHRADLSDFDGIPNLSIQISTDDGSEGHSGYVTDLVTNMLNHSENDRPDGVYCCGPVPMMNAVAKICAEQNVPCWLSLETPMACGFGACFSCVTKVRMDDGNWDYRRTCVEGPVFPAESLAID